MGLLLGFFISIFISIYLARNARKYNKNPWLWALLGFSFGIMTLGIFLIKTQRKVSGLVLVIISSILYFLIITGIITYISEH